MATRSTPEAARFDEYVGRLAVAVGHADRREPLRAYLTGLLLPGERKSVEPMAARLDPRHVQARHQSMHHFVSAAPWDDAAVLDIARDHALSQLERHAPVAAWVVDDTAFRKKGTRSVGVARQYCGVIGKQDNCQAVVTISLVNATMSVPAAYRLYLPQAWAGSKDRRAAAGVPGEVVFAEKWRIALREIGRLVAEDLPRAPVVADAGYGEVTAFREGLAALGLSYAVGIQRQTTFWPPRKGPLSPKPYGGRGQPPKLLRRDADHQPVSAETLAESLPASAWRTVQWREGTRGRMSSRFAAVRVRAAHRDYWRRTLREEEWLLVEWPADAPAPTKYSLSNVPRDAALVDLARLVKVRWRIERDYEELKQELGLGHYEGRGWRGFHHHGTLCIAAYCFLAAERARLSPPEPLAFLRAPALPRGFRPRGAPAAAGAP